MLPSVWLGLMIGNSRLHWAYFEDETLKYSWNTDQSSLTFLDSLLPSHIEVKHPIPLYIASVVPSQTQIWQDYFPSQLITLEDIPLKKLYDTIGIDRALAVLGAGEIYGFPCLVIDAGTALTFTGVDEQRNLVGGAILSGLSLQFQALSTNTAALPQIKLPDHLPSQWALNTPTAIESGIIYTILYGIEGFINCWCQQFPNSSILLTGGDAEAILHYLKQYNLDLAAQIKIDEHLIFWGMSILKLDIT